MIIQKKIDRFQNFFSISLRNSLLSNTDIEKDYKFFFLQLNKAKLTNQKIYKLKEKNFHYFLKIKKLKSFLITNSSILRLYNDQPIGFHCLFPKKLHFSQKRVIAGNFLNPSLKLSKSGFFLKKNGSEILFQSTANTFVSQASLLKKNRNNFLKKNEILGYELTYQKKAKDIAQGLPKIESLIEAYSSKIELKDISRSSIFFSKPIINCLLSSKSSSYKKNFEHVYFQSLFTNDIIVSYRRLLYKLTQIPFFYTPKKTRTAVSHSTLFKKKSFLEKYYGGYFHTVENYSFTTENRKKKFQYISKIVDRFKIKEKYYDDKYWPIYTKSIWLYKLEKFRLFKWLKIKPILWIPGIAKYEKNDLENISEFCLFSKSMNSNLIVKSNTGKYYYLQLINLLERHNNFNIKVTENNQLSLSSIHSKKLKFNFFNNFLNFIYLGENVVQDFLNIQKILIAIFNYHSLLDGSYIGLLKSILKFQSILALSIEDSYKSQGVKISRKNIEIVVKQMLNKVIIEDPKTTNLLPLELIKVVVIKEICNSIKKYNSNTKEKNKDKIKISRFESFPIFKPKIFSTTNSVLSQEGFLTQAGFQNTKKVLTKAAIEGSLDWLANLKQRIIVGQVLSSGSTFFNSKYNLDSIYLFKSINSKIYESK